MGLAIPLAGLASDVEPAPQRATIKVDASLVRGQLSPLLYGQFLEYMFQCIKGGLHGELIRNRSFEEPANVLGLSRDWEPYPDSRNHDLSLISPGMPPPLIRNGRFRTEVPTRPHFGSTYIKASSTVTVYAR